MLPLLVWIDQSILFCLWFRATNLPLSDAELTKKSYSVNLCISALSWNNIIIDDVRLNGKHDCSSGPFIRIFECSFVFHWLCNCCTAKALYALRCVHCFKFLSRFYYILPFNNGHKSYMYVKKSFTFQASTLANVYTECFVCVHWPTLIFSFVHTSNPRDCEQI